MVYLRVQPSSSGRVKRGHRGGGPLTHETDLYKERNTVERSSRYSRTGL